MTLSLVAAWSSVSGAQDVVQGLELPVRDWLAVPRDIETLSVKSRDRLIDARTIANARFDGGLVTRRLQEMAA